MKLTGLITDILPKITNYAFGLDKDKKYTVEIKQYREARSLNANNYAWSLMTKIAEKVPTSKEAVYEQMLQDYGTNLIDEDGDIVKISTQANLKSSESMHIAFIGQGYIGDKVFNHYRVIKGSSQYNTKEMSIFIDGIVHECKQLGIETMTPDELERLKNSWR